MKIARCVQEAKGYYGVKLSEREIKTASYIYNSIIDKLAEKSVETRPDTYMQKTAVEVVRELKLNFVTRGILHYGEILALPPGNALSEVKFEETELSKIISKEDFDLLVKSKCNKFDYEEGKNKISAAQHKMHDNHLFVQFDLFESAMDENRNIEDFFTILNSINKEFEKLPETSFTRKSTGKKLEGFISIAKELSWKKNRYNVVEDLKPSFDKLRKMIGNCRFHDTVEGDSKEDYLKKTKQEHVIKEGEYCRSFEDLINKLTLYTRIDQKKTETACINT